ncbi:unnamed protein product, partial [Mesorhabditis belari]|uniref:Uncharacterized protein n=1 Tax=Mesorhabditis belari TaxID=2138241 RepID=A0AAF3ETK2_9BILA
MDEPESPNETARNHLSSGSSGGANAIFYTPEAEMECGFDEDEAIRKARSISFIVRRLERENVFFYT